MKKKKISVGYMKMAFLIIVALFFVTQINATTFLVLTLKDLCIKSTDIIISRVDSIESYWNSDKTRMYTDVHLEVEDNLKGRFQKLDKLTLKLYGGTIDGITTFVVGAPQFKLGERSLLFLLEQQFAGSEQNDYVVVGMSQGKYNIFTDNSNDKKVVRDQQIGAPLQSEKNGTHISITNSRSITLVNFLNYIRSYVK